MPASSQLLNNREFAFTKQNFEKVVKLINDFSGISLSDRKADMVYSRLARRLRKVGLTEFDQYLELPKEDS